MIFITLLNFIIMGGFIYLMWCGLKWIILRPYIQMNKKRVDEESALKRAREKGRRRPSTIDGGTIYPKKKEPEEVLLIEYKRK